VVVRSSTVTPTPARWPPSWPGATPRLTATPASSRFATSRSTRRCASA